ncbi:MAG: M23 family metallopeptidase [Treponema sp.]|nr:M23 family metallopeptidase [Treponema sp.]
MEIINYVQEPRRRQSSRFYRNTIGNINLPREKKTVKIRRRKENVSYSVSMPSERHTFRAGTVKNSVTLKSALAFIGSNASDGFNFVKENFLKSLIVVAVIAVVSGAAYGISRFVSYRANHTGPVVLNMAGDSIDIENLDKFMSEFAFEDPEVNQDGSIADVEIDLSKIITEPVTFQTYKVRSGDTISGIAYKFGLRNISTLIAVNNIGNVRQLSAGQKLKIPSMDGIYYTVKSGDSINSIAEKYKIKMESLVDVNEITSEVLTSGQTLFIPGAALDQKTLNKAMGELFSMPIKDKFRWTSPYGWRADPFTGVKSFHTGTDMACPTGTPIYATMSGRVTYTGVSPIFGNYVIMDHGNGYQTWYAHMSKITTKKGEYINQNGKIGLVGSTGYSTGPHLHFMVYKNGKRIDPMTVLKK